MSSDWIKMRTNLWNDPRIGGLVDATGTSEATVIGGLYWLWTTADEHTTDGNIAGLSLRTLDRKTGIPGFGAALVAVGWLNATDDRLQIVRFEEHNGASTKRRIVENKRKFDQREAATKFEDGCDTSDKCPQACGQNADAMPPPTGQSAPQEQEQEQERTLKPSSAKAEVSAARLPPPCPHERIVAEYHEALPTLPQVREWHETRRKLLQSRWRERFAQGKFATQEEGVAWFRKFFGYVGQSRFLCGQTQPAPGRDPFTADLEWLIRPANFAKVIEGRYHGAEQ